MSANTAHNRKDQTAPLTYEEKHRRAGRSIIVGMDEAGYGAWAGDVAVAAVCLPLESPTLDAQLHGVKDSKQMTPLQRQGAYETIQQVALGWGIGHASPNEINTVGLAKALALAYSRAYSACAEMLLAQGLSVDALLLDGKSAWRAFAQAEVMVERIVRGDGLSLSIAAASVLAKVWRDSRMVALAEQYPPYGFDTHKGYGTAAHHSAILQYGVLEGVHRRTYKPIAALLSR